MTALSRHEFPSLGRAGAGRHYLIRRCAGVRLTEVFRQAAQSRIITTAHLINQAQSLISTRPAPRATSISCRRTIPKPPLLALSSSQSREFRARPHPRHPADMPDEPRWSGRAVFKLIPPRDVQTLPEWQTDTAGVAIHDAKFHLLSCCRRRKRTGPDRSRYKLGGGSAAARLRLTLEASVGVGCILAIRSMVEAEQFNLLRVRPLVRPTRSGRSDLLDRDYHPEWGILALGESSVRTLRLLAVATAIGAVIGGGIVFSMTRPLEDARLPVPGAINTRSTETSDRFQQPPEQASPRRCHQCRIQSLRGRHLLRQRP